MVKTFYVFRKNAKGHGLEIELDGQNIRQDNVGDRALYLVQEVLADETHRIVSTQILEGN